MNEKKNLALWLHKARAGLEVGQAPYTKPRAGEIVIRNSAVAINIFDHLMRTIGHLVTPYLSYPAVLGSDVSGTVVEVGDGVRRFCVGDRVVGFAAGGHSSRNKSSEGGFQDYVVLLEHMTSPIPDEMAFEEACVLPLGISTAACGLFQDDYLALAPPSLEHSDERQTVLVWGGSTSVGSNAIQLSRAAGYNVVTTASPRNFDYVKRLGAEKAFDYRDPDIVRKVVSALRGKRLAGAFAVGSGSAKACIDIVSKCEGRRFVAQATTPASFEGIPAGRGHWRALLPVMVKMIVGNVSIALRAKRKGISTKFIWGSALVDNDIGPMIFERFLPEALDRGVYEAVPTPKVVGKGLHAISAALEERQRGVSATKIVVSLP